MNIRGNVVLRAGITWGIVAVVLAVLAAVFAPILPQVSGLTLGAYALLMAGIHYSARARSDLFQSAVGGGLSGALAGAFLVVVRLIQVVRLPTPPGAPTDFLAALIIGFVAGVAGGLGYKVIDR